MQTPDATVELEDNTEGAKPQDDVTSEIIKDASKIDEVKRLEKIYEMSKEMFQYSENAIRTLEDKSRNNIAAVAAIATFTFVVRKPIDLSSLDVAAIPSLALIAFIVVFTGIVYFLHFSAVIPKTTSMPSFKHLDTMFYETVYPVGVLRYNLETMQRLYSLNLSSIDKKGRLVTKQQKLLGLVLIAALSYIVLGGIPSSSSKTPTQVAPNATTPTSQGLTIKRMSDNSEQTPVPNPPQPTSQPDPYARPKPDFIDVQKGVPPIREGNNQPPQPIPTEKKPQ